MSVEENIEKAVCHYNTKLSSPTGIKPVGSTHMGNKIADAPAMFPLWDRLLTLTQISVTLRLCMMT